MQAILARSLWAAAIALAALGVWKLMGSILLARARRITGIVDFVRGKPAILVFGSPHCAPCVHSQKPAARKLELELGGAIQLIEVDVTEKPALAERYGVLSLPTVFIFDRTGAARRVNHGVVSKDELRRQIDPYLVCTPGSSPAGAP